MNGLEAFSLSRKKNCDFYRQKIAEHTPPKTAHDERMIRIYQRFLVRDRSFLQNLDLLNLIEGMRKDTLADVSAPTSHLSAPAASLDLDEFRALLDENG